MADEDKPKAAKTDNPSTDDVVRPFQEASNRFLQAAVAAHESAVKQAAHAWLDRNDEARQAEQELFSAVTAATRKYVDQLGQQGDASLADVSSARAEAQAEYDKELKHLAADAEAKLSAIARKACDGSGTNDAAQQRTNQLQQAYQAYMSDLQQAWSGTKALDPQTINAIASHILTTINCVSQAG
jgi:hypothetical protein